MMQMIGQGAYGQVFKARHIPTGKICAVKKLFTQDIESKDLIDFCREVGVLAKCDNLFLVPFYGWKPTIPLLIVTEYIPNGSLFGALRHRKGAPSLTPTQKTIIALGICKGMASLHAMGIIHRDLKSLNILLDKKLFPRICDFGTSRLTSESNLMTKNVGTPHWMAPESFVSTDYTNKVDVYAFGIMMWEMLTETAPFQGKDGIQIAIAVSQNQERPAFPDKTPKELKQFINALWNQDPNNRPTFEQAYNAIASKKVMFPGTEPAAIDYVINEIKDDQIIRSEIRGAREPPLKYNKAQVISAQANRKRNNTVLSTKRPPPMIKSVSNVLEVPRFDDILNFSIPNYQKNFTLCMQNLTPENAPKFFHMLVRCFSPTTPKNISEIVVENLNQLIRSNANYFNLFIENDLLHHLPINSEKSVKYTFEIALFVVTQRPTLIDKPFVRYISPFINHEYADKTLRILYPIVQMFDRLSNGWIASDHLIKASTNFFNTSPVLYLQMLYYLMSNYSQFNNARFEYIIPIFNNYIANSTSSQVIINVYSLMIMFYSPKYNIDPNIILKHLQNPETTTITLSFLIKQKSIHLTKEIMSYLLALLPSNQNAYYTILCQCDRTKSGDSLLANGGQWILNGKMSVKQVVNLLLVLLVFSELRPIISSFNEIPMFLSQLMHSNDIKMIEVASSIIVKLVSTPMDLHKYEQNGFFTNYQQTVMKLNDKESLSTCFFMIDTLSRIGLISEFLGLVEYFVEFLKTNNCYTLSVLSTLCSLSQYPQTQSILRNTNCAKYIEDLAGIQQYLPYINILRKIIQ
ncbi:TKL family protein kinase [Histomonas meleagridis]|uniref:TKL family protein kinase n=1 Tax=Histomonas meleagridis TaxID=135588 RepID=UPI00355AA34F|nr:TKL family protein kinase [Histomonas meleagridis]KAH0806202.1 TKL family protein kinase [Histomonas meleagridis]